MAARRDRVERRAGLVHEDDVRLHGERAGNAQPLRLPAGEAQARGLEPVLHLVPQRGLAQRALDDLIQPALVVLAVDARSIGDVVVDRLRERVGLLEDHADAPAHGYRGDILGVQRCPTVVHLTVDVSTRYEVVHAVQRPQHRRLAAPGRADERRDLVLVDGQRDVRDGPERAVVAGDLLRIEDSRARRIERSCARRHLHLGLGQLGIGDDVLFWLVHGVPGAAFWRDIPSANIW